MQRKYTITVTDTETNAVIYNAKGDLTTGQTYNGININASVTPASASVTFSSTGAVTSTSATATTWVQTGTGWIGGSNYRITWTTPDAGTIGANLPDSYSPTTAGNQLLSSNRIFTCTATSLGLQEARYQIVIRNLATSAQQSWTVSVRVEAASTGGTSGGGGPGGSLN